MKRMNTFNVVTVIILVMIGVISLVVDLSWQKPKQNKPMTDNSNQKIEMEDSNVKSLNNSSTQQDIDSVQM